MTEIDLGIDDLEQFKVVGSGGFATVYAAWDIKFRRWVAVKVLDSLDDAGLRRFEREQGLMGQFDDHAHIVTPYRSGYTNTGAPNLVMEYLRRGSLQDTIDNDGPLPIDDATRYVLPIAKALGRAHTDGVLHRDVKPANILLATDDTPKLTDFGIATIREATSTQFAFTLAHSPPETFSSGYDNRDERSDLYSLASTLYTLIAGRAPFDVERPDDSQLAYMRRIEANEPPPTGHRRIDEVLARAMAKAPQDRYATADHFISALTDLSEPAPETPAAGPQPSGHDTIYSPPSLTPSRPSEPATGAAPPPSTPPARLTQPSAADPATSRAPAPADGPSDAPWADRPLTGTDSNDTLPARRRWLARTTAGLAVGVLLLVGAYYAGDYWARQTWYIDIDESGQIVTVNGRPDGFWIFTGDTEGTLLRTPVGGSVNESQLSDTARVSIAEGRTFPSLEDAVFFLLDNLLDSNASTGEAGTAEGTGAGEAVEDDTLDDLFEGATEGG